MAKNTVVAESPSLITATPPPATPPNIAMKTLLETALPYRELSLLARADRRSVDPVYATHKWWARRPPGVIRGLLLAADMPETCGIDEFWVRFKESTEHLAGRRVHDMFAGGGAMLVEAARLGATPSGTDVDPLAIEIIRHELEPATADQVSPVLDELLAALVKQFGNLYPASSMKHLPLHYFYLNVVTCPDCGWEAALYKNLIIARDAKKSGGVVRDSAITAFCPDCFDLHELPNLRRKTLTCCSRRTPLDKGTFSNGKYSCPNCGCKSDHARLKTGLAKRKLIAVEETFIGGRRKIRMPNALDLAAEPAATDFLEKSKTHLLYPTKHLETKRADSRPISFGIETADQLFTTRQLCVFGYAFNWIAGKDLSRPVRRALRLALSNALTTNNRLCSYATDYGRIAPLFSVRSYSMPWLSVELNPLHPEAGRGTLAKTMQKIVRSTGTSTHRSVWNVAKRALETTKFDFPLLKSKPDLRCVSATEPLVGLEPIDICLFDPPYFDYIAYSELSEFYRVWHSRNALGGIPLLPDIDSPCESFGKELGECLIQVLNVLKLGKPLVFTFHSLDPNAWKSIAIALQHAKVKVTAIWPVLNDSHMGHHGASGNCEWDLVVACRRAVECEPGGLLPTLAHWKKTVKPLHIGKADERAISLALESLKPLFAAVAS